MIEHLTQDTVDDATQSGRILVARCTQCGAEQTMPGDSCFRCGSSSLSLYEHEGRGTIYSWMVGYVGFDTTFDGEVPYTVMIVELSGGARVYARLSPDDEVGEELRAGRPVVVDVIMTRSLGHLVFGTNLQAAP